MTKFVLLMLAVGIGSILSILPLFVAVMPSPWREVVILGIVGIALSLAAAVISRWGEKRRKAKELKQLQMEAERQAEEERRLEEAKVVWWQDEKTRREGEERERGKLKEITGQKQEERGPWLFDIQRPRPIDEKHTLYGWQEGRCNGCGVLFHFRNLTLDHITPRTNDGPDHIDNLQLLCGTCNSLKGAGTHEELLEKLRSQGVT